MSSKNDRIPLELDLNRLQDEDSMIRSLKQTFYEDNLLQPWHQCEKLFITGRSVYVPMSECLSASKFPKSDIRSDCQEHS